MPRRTRRLFSRIYESSRWRSDASSRYDSHTTRAQSFAGTKALKTQACTVLLDTGSPASFIQEKVWLRMLACGAAFPDGLTEIEPKTWGGFHGIPLTTSNYVRLNVQLGNTEKNSRGTVRLVVHAYIVPDKAMQMPVLLGRDSWSFFPVRKYRDLNSTQTLVTFVGTEGESVSGDHRFNQWVNNAVGMIEGDSDSSVVVRVAGSKFRLPNAMSWVSVALTNADGTAAPTGSYYIRFGSEWSPQEAIVEAGVSQIPLQRLNSENFLIQKNMKLGEGGGKLTQCNLDSAEIFSTNVQEVSAVVGGSSPSPGVSNDEPPQTVLASLNPSQREAFIRLWNKVPVYLREIHFDFEESLWTAKDIDALGNLLCKYAHRFSKHSTDLGHVTVDPFRIILKKDAQPVKQRPYRHSPVLAAKVQTEIDKLVLAGILRRSYSNWCSPLVVIAKADGRIRLTCNYKRLNEQSIIPVMPLPTVDDLLSDLGGAKVFSSMDLVSGFFQCSIHEDSIPLTAVCTQQGIYEWMEMPMGLASSPGWFQSILLRVCEGLQRVRLFIDDIVCFSSSGAEHVQDLEHFFSRLTKFDLKLAPKKAYLGVKVIKFLGHRVTAKGIEPDPGKVEAMTKLPMPTNVSQLRSILGALSYYRKFLPQMATFSRPLNNLLKKDVKFVFTTEHVEIVQVLIKRLLSPDVLAFPDFQAAMSGKRPFRLITDASLDGLGAVIEQDQPDSSTRPLSFLSRTTMPNERNWSATELECAAIVWAVKKNRQLFYGIPFIVVSDHQPLKNLESLSTKVNRVQRWYDFLSAYTYTLEYRPGKANGNADLMSRLPLPATEADNHPDVRLSDPTDIDVYLIGASGVHSAQLAEPMGSSLDGLKELDPGLIFTVGERELRTAPLTTNEKSTRAWQVIQSERAKRQSVEVEPPSIFAVPDDTPLVRPSQVVSGQWEPGLVLHACPLTEEGRLLLGMKNMQSVGVIDPIEEGSSAGVAGSSENHDELPEEDLDSMEAREFGEKLCEKTASDWAVAQ